MNVFAELIVAVVLSVFVAVPVSIIITKEMGALLALIIFGFCVARMVMGKGIYKSLTNKSNDDQLK